MTTRPVLIFDLANVFMRAWCAFPQINTNGEPMGGFVGTLKTISRVLNETGAKKIFVAWEGGGSTKRRAIYSEYKLGRKPEKLNRFYEEDIPSTDENSNKQKLLLLQALKFLPVCQLYASDCEGDDLVAYLCCNTLRNEDKVIVSSDRDFYQLLDDKTKIYNLHKKKVLTKDDVLAEFRISSRNFAVAKSICGDKGDNVPGLDKIGFKTLVKHVPMLGSDVDVSLDKIFDFCRSNSNKVTDKICAFEKDARRNWKLVFLNGNMIPHNQAARIDSIVSTFEPRVNKMEFIKLVAKEGINDFQFVDFVQSFRAIEGIKYVT